MDPAPVSSPPAPEPVTRLEITPSVGFGWLTDTIRPYLGWICLVAGLVALFLGWYGASGTPIVAKQVPYLASDGVLAVVLIAIGNRIFLINDLRRDSGRLDRLEEMVSELHAVLLGASGRGGGSRPRRRHRSAPAHQAVPRRGARHQLPPARLLDGVGQGGGRHQQR